jgi:D-alanine-D-alanine ligase-like ATP-grasp enzyme
VTDTLRHYSSIIIQEFHGNLNSYRVLLLNHKPIGVVIRYAAHVIGDGVLNLEALIEKTNKERLAISDALGPIVVDTECNIRLQELGIDLSYIPDLNQWVTLCYTCNASRGGTYASLQTQMCRENQKLFSRVSRVLNLPVVGLDIECVDINLPIETTRGVIIETNPTPSVRIHDKAIEGIKVPVTRKILRTLMWRHPLAYLWSFMRNCCII